MELIELDIRGISLLLRKVYLPVIESMARTKSDEKWLHSVHDFQDLMMHFEMMVQHPDLLVRNSVASTATKKTSVGSKPSPLPTKFASTRDEDIYWQTQLKEFSTAKCCMVHQWGEATTEIDVSLRQVHYTLRLFRLVRGPIEVFTENKCSLVRAEANVKALVCALKAVVLQSPEKSGVHSKFAELVTNNTDSLASWARQVLSARNDDTDQKVMAALRLWENQWAHSGLELVAKLTTQEFSDMFHGTRTVLHSLETMQSLAKETRALQSIVQQIEDYFIRQKLLASIRNQLEAKIEAVETRLFLVEYRTEFTDFLQDFQMTQKTIEIQIQSNVKTITESHTSFEGLKLLRKMIDASQALAGTHSASLDPFLLQQWRDQLNKLSTELRIIRKGFDVTDYLTDKDTGNVDMAQKLFERRLLYHRVKISLLIIFPKPIDWDESSASVKVKEQYVELAKYLKSTEDKLHHKWFVSVQRRANRAMTKPILKKLTGNKISSANSTVSSVSVASTIAFGTTLQDTLTTIWDESRLFLQTRFQIPHVSHVLLMQQPDLVHRNRDLVAILERLSSVVDNLKPHEFSVLNNSYSAVENGLELGMTHVTWPSLCLANYIQELAESVDRFQGMAHDIALISDVLERRIAQILNHRLLHMTEQQQESSSAEDFFQRLSHSGDNFFADVRRVVSELPDVLLQVESIVNYTQTGSAVELQNYYDHWRQRVYRTVLQSVQDRFGELSLLLERGPAQFSVRVSLSSAAEIQVEPDLESIERRVGQIVHYWIKKSAIVPNWRQGTCLEAEGNDAVDTFYDRFGKEPLLTKTVERDKKHCRHLVAQLREVIERWNDCAELWSTNKEQVCRELDARQPTVAQYDETMWHYRHYWSERLEAMDEEVVIACVTLHCAELKAAAQQHASQWVKQLGATWLEGTRNKLVRLKELLQVTDEDGGVNIDIEILIAQVNESWHRLRHYKIKVPDEMQKQLTDFETTLKLMRKGLN